MVSPTETADHSYNRAACDYRSILKADEPRWGSHLPLILPQNLYFGDLEN